MNRIQTKTRLSKILYFYEINVLVTVYFSEIQNFSFRLQQNAYKYHQKLLNITKYSFTSLQCDHKEMNNSCSRL